MSENTQPKPLRILGAWPTKTQIQNERMRRNFALFAKEAWGQIDPAPLIWDIHMDAMCAGLQAVADGRIQDLLINIPPGHAKSMVASVLWHVWRWVRDPSWQLLCASYEVGLATRDAVKARELMGTQWFVERFGKVDFKADQDLKQFYANTSGGHRQSLGAGGKATGYRGDTLLVDDPLKAEDAYSEIARATVKRWFSETMESRFNDQLTRERVIIMQRLHEDDLSAHVLKQGGWQHLCLSAEFDPDERCTIVAKDGSVVWTDPRTVRGQPLFPAKFPVEVLAKLKIAMGAYAFSAQFLQRATPATGGVIKRAWTNNRWHYPGQTYSTPPLAQDGAPFNLRPIPLQFDSWELHCDATFKNTANSDFVACEVWARKGPDLYLVDMIWKRMGFTETMTALLSLKAKWRKIGAVCIEDKANGSAIVEVFKQSISGVIPIEPEGGKEARIHAASLYFESGNVWLPMDHPQIGEFIEEACSFPMAKYDDAIDCAAQAINRMLTKSDLAWLELLVEGGSGVEWAKRFGG